MIKNTEKKYGSVAQIFHWLIALLIIGMLALGFIANNMDSSALKGSLFWTHKSLGLTLLILMLLRLIWRLINTTPGYPRSTPRWQQWAARMVHWGFYAAIIGTIIMGWTMSSLGKYGVPFWGWFDARLPLAASEYWHHLTETWHSILAWVIIALIVIHIAAAIKHALIDKDGIYQRMLPSSISE